MTKSQIFKKAHEIARETKEIAGSYRIAFACALKALYNGVIKMEKSMKETLIEAGAEVWENYGYKRIYLNEEIVRNLGFVQETNGKWYKGEARITSTTMKAVCGCGFYDLDKNDWNFKKCGGRIEEARVFAAAI